ncbi:MBL fold metallo-hydrolase [Halospeciosus flavus]|uniref:MBL fold metallo-hydrolase n=1 Tax=Halospeciosus flavus TaxID=3032283 RepID=A0ABD5Z823_9EURY|nr:MBL fold metallo-hydrolase [Halospeciosus flavus]
MTAGDRYEATACDGVHYVDTGMYDTSEYGAAYVVDAERPAFVDTGIGTNYEYLLDALDDLDIDPADVEVIAPTHVHLDHAGGAGYLAEACPNADVYVHEVGAPHLVDPSRLVEGTKQAVGDQWQHYAEPNPVPEVRIVELTDGDEIDLGDRVFDVHHAPGHAPHQVVFHDRRDDALFTADAAGIWVPPLEEVHPTSPPPNFDLEQCLDDVEMLRDLDPESLLFGHFGECPADPDTVLADYADVLTEWVDRIAEKYAELGDETAVQEYFADESDLDDVWYPERARAEARMNVRGVLRYLQRRE